MFCNSSFDPKIFNLRNVGLETLTIFLEIKTKQNILPDFSVSDAFLRASLFKNNNFHLCYFFYFSLYFLWENRNYRNVSPPPPQYFY